MNEAFIDVSHLIDRKRERDAQEPRPHIGASTIGGDCLRKAWLDFRWAYNKPFSGRMLRLFDRGHREEDVAVKLLKSIGARFGRRQESKFVLDGVFGGSHDGEILHLQPGVLAQRMLFECKTHNDKSFKQLEKKGVEKSKPQHFRQMQTYMGLFDFPIALYYAINKNDDTIYTEFVVYRPEVFQSMLDKAQMVISADTPPERAGSPKSIVCKVCDYKDICHGDQIPEVNCRTCLHSTPTSNCEFACDEYKATVSVERQRRSGKCPKHLFIPDLLPFGRPTDASPGSVTYMMDDVPVTNSVKDYGTGYTSQEISRADISLLSDPLLSELKDRFHAELKPDD